MASDGRAQETELPGFSLSLTVPTRRRRTAFAALAEGGKVQLPLAKTFRRVSAW